MVRKDRSDIKIGNLEKKHGLPKGIMRHPDGRKIRKDAKLGTMKNKIGK